MAPVAAVDAKLSAWQAKSQAALASGRLRDFHDAAGRDHEPVVCCQHQEGTPRPLLGASESADGYRPQLEELDGESVAHRRRRDAHNRAIEENLNRKEN